ncbi:MAG: methyltransferase domain-containing protein, partial [Alphaproteobacteria bacterium]|nr:methyltransferase domain-containing protein [Alphaproteobacteria bacterium]
MTTAAEIAAEAYQRLLVPVVYGPWAAAVIKVAAPAQGERALDVACGTGAATFLLAAGVGPVGRVAGVDFNPAMLAVARRLAAERGVVIDFRAATAEALPFADESFDLVTCVQAFQSFPDLGRALAEMRRVLRRGGRLVGSVWRHIDHCPGYLALSQVIARHVGPAAATFGPGILGDSRV